MHEILLALAIVLILIYLYHQCSQPLSDNIVIVEKENSEGANSKPPVIITEIIEEDTDATACSAKGIVCEYAAVNDSLETFNNAPKATHFPSAIRSISAK